MLAAGLGGIDRRLEAGDRIRRTCTRCRRRVDYVDYYVRVKRREWQAAHEQITQWELDRYLQLY